MVILYSMRDDSFLIKRLQRSKVTPGFPTGVHLKTEDTHIVEKLHFAGGKMEIYVLDSTHSLYEDIL